MPTDKEDQPPVVDETVNVWGTKKELIDSDEFCPECEREVPRHYDNCPLYKKGVGPLGYF